MLKAPGTDRLKPNCHTLLSNAAITFNLRRYNTVTFASGSADPLAFLMADVGAELRQATAADLAMCMFGEGSEAVTR
jgi:hypothetical protein